MQLNLVVFVLTKFWVHNVCDECVWADSDETEPDGLVI